MMQLKIVASYFLTDTLSFYLNTGSNRYAIATRNTTLLADTTIEIPGPVNIQKSAAEDRSDRGQQTEFSETVVNCVDFGGLAHKNSSGSNFDKDVPARACA